MIKDAVRQCPLSLVNIQGHSYVNNILPYSTGIEMSIETRFLFKESTYEHFKYKPTGAFYCESIEKEFNLIDCYCDTHEFKFRIKPGIQGMISLYNMCEFLKQYAIFNPSDKAGNHYHIDCSEIDRFWEFSSLSTYMDNIWALDSLKSWNYKGSYNPYVITGRKSGVISFREKFSTIEFRLGESSFDYSLIIKRIIHAQNIVKKFKKQYYIADKSAKHS